MLDVVAAAATTVPFINVTCTVHTYTNICSVYDIRMWHEVARSFKFERYRKKIYCVFTAHVLCSYESVCIWVFFRCCLSLNHEISIGVVTPKRMIIQHESSPIRSFVHLWLNAIMMNVLLWTYWKSNQHTRTHKRTISLLVSLDSIAYHSVEHMYKQTSKTS